MLRLAAVVIAAALALAAPASGKAHAADTCPDSSIDVRAELLEVAFAPCFAVAAWKSGLARTLGIDDAITVLLERNMTRTERAVEDMTAAMCGKTPAERRSMARTFRVGCIDAVIQD